MSIKLPGIRPCAVLTVTSLVVALFLILWSGPAQAWPPGGNGGGGGKPPKDPPPPDPPATYPTYTYQSVGTLGGATSTAEGLNDAGTVVGVSELADGTSSPYVYTPANGMQDLNVLNDGPLDYPARTIYKNGVLYVVNGGHFDGAGSVVMYDAATGEFIDYFVPIGSGGLEIPAPMDFGPYGDLYIPTHSGPNTRRNRVAKYDGSDGEYLGDFVTHGAGGVDGISGMIFGNDVGGAGADGSDPDGVNDLFLSSARTDEIKVYSGADGSFLGDFVNAGDGGLDGPGALLFRDLDNDGSDELIVASRQTVSVLVYDGTTGAPLQSLVPAAELTPYVSLLTDIQFGPDDRLYITGLDEIWTVNGTDHQTQVLRCDALTGMNVELFIAPGDGGWLSAAPRITFGDQGDVFVNSGNTNQILRYEGPLSANPGMPIGIFAEGTGFILSTARDINSSGQTVGWGHSVGRIVPSSNEKAAYRYTPPAPGKLVGRVDNLGVLGLNFDEEATAINNDGDVAGHFVSASDGRYHAFLWSEATGPIDLGTLAGEDTFVTAINDRVGGDVQVAGFASTNNGERAWLYDTATGQMQDLGLIKNKGGNLAARGFDLNNLGQVVGWSSAGGGKEHAFLFTDGAGMDDLGTLGGNNSAAFGLNDLWDVVGMADLESGASVGFVHTAETGLFELEPQITNLPGSLSGQIMPWRINNSGQIIGPSGLGVSEAYIITPVAP